MNIQDKNIKFSFLMEFNLVLQDLDRIFGFIEPHDDNLKVYSHRVFELFLRTCTAVEAVFKQLLDDSAYILPTGKINLNMEDYFTLKNSLEVCRYEVSIGSWRNGGKIFLPFYLWSNTETYTPLDWYKAYNKAKHNRYQEFPKANILNLVEAIAGLFVLLYTQYDKDVFGKYQETSSWEKDENDRIYSGDCIFSIKKYTKDLLP